MTTENLFTLAEKTVQWAEDRNIVKGASADRQILKVFEEAGEIDDALALADVDGLKDGVGDTLVTLIILAEQMGFSSQQIIADAYNTINAPNFDPTSINFMGSLGRISGKIARGKTDEVDTFVRDIVIFLISFSASLGQFTEVEALEVAYDEIKDRRGRMINGVFVKESDLPENQVA
ncbi:nucleoside triphosphate pyrophosphohydrolase-like protein [Ochrobactrum phage vB_OspM_OC]|nr:nucleoside triphosphate pyrophosphohydrolase-like protein [Ochrobactrum phage vB_OspM_OC]